MNWALDFCLYCDRQTHTEEPYCSQACRLADLEKPGFSSSSSSSFSAPASHSHSTSSSSHHRTTWSSVANRSTNFNLPPPFNFEPYRNRNGPKIESPPLSPRSQGASSSGTQNANTTNSRSTLQYRSTDYQYYQRSLNSSSSRSSLSSVSSANSIQGLTELALSQLQGYSNAFDHVRDSKRRTTLG